jgi:hypothetical protein
MAPTRRKEPVQKKRRVLQDTQAKFKVREKFLQLRHQEIAEAVKYCQENNCKGKKALSTGKFTNIGDYRAINAALERGTSSHFSGSKNTILTLDEEQSLVAHIRNKNRAGQGLKRKDITKLICDILTIRNHVNQKHKGGRKYIALSKSARNVLQMYVPQMIINTYKLKFYPGMEKN